MKDQISKIFESIRSQLDRDDECREEILPISRRVVRKCAETIRATHRREFDSAENLILSAKANLEKLVELIPGNSLFENLVTTAYQEYVEALQFFHFVNRDWKKPFNLISLENIQRDIPITYNAYLHGLCDLIGEIRRFTLDSIRTDNIKSGEESLNLMDEIFIQLTTLDYPNGLLPGLRRKTDIARNLIERTRGDLTLAFNRRALVQKLDMVMNDKVSKQKL